MELSGSAFTHHMGIHRVWTFWVKTFDDYCVEIFYLNIPKYRSHFYVQKQLPLDETQLMSPWEALSTKKFQPKCVNKESLARASKRRYFVRQGLTVLLMLMTRTWCKVEEFRVASLSLVSFHHSSVSSWGRLTSYISISSFRRTILSYRFLSSC